MEIPAAIVEKLVEYVDDSAKMFEKRAEVERKVNEVGPSVVDTLVKRGLVDAKNRESALRAIEDPVKVLESLKKTAEFVERAKEERPIPSMGSAAEIKEAAGEKTSGESAEMREVNRRFVRSLGLRG